MSDFEMCDSLSVLQCLVQSTICKCLKRASQRSIEASFSRPRGAKRDRRSKALNPAFFPACPSLLRLWELHCRHVISGDQIGKAAQSHFLERADASKGREWRVAKIEVGEVAIINLFSALPSRGLEENTFEESSEREQIGHLSEMDGGEIRVISLEVTVSRFLSGRFSKVRDQAQEFKIRGLIDS